MTGNQDLFLDVLGSTGTKREAKSYLSRFSPSKLGIKHPNGPEEKQLGLNMGNLHLPLRAVDESPVFTQAPQSQFLDQGTDSLHVALVKIRAPHSITDAILQGVGHTLSQLTRLGLICVVVIDAEGGAISSSVDACHLALEQGERVVTAIDLYRGQGARLLDNVIGVSSIQEQKTKKFGNRGQLRITHQNLILAPLQRGLIPVIVPIGFMSGTQTLVPVEANDVVLALTRKFAGPQARSLIPEDPHKLTQEVQVLQREISLDRVILLDSLGGIPSGDTLHGSHVFINLEQEYEGIRWSLQRSMGNIEPGMVPSLTARISSSPLAVINPNSSSKLNDFAFTTPIDRSATTMPIDSTRIASHIRNLDLLKDTLAILPPSSSAIITTPQEAANSGRSSMQLSQSLGVGTRRLQNPLIHNLLTDKPVISSSLPSDRCQQTLNTASHPASIPSPATFVKRGMPISIFPDPNILPWTPPTPSSAPLKLSDLPIDIPRLVYLIEDSFKRKLDVNDYFSRINNRIAGIIVAGEYEGGAILTWEVPPGFPSSSPPVPYLDKFAVLKRAQGAGGVADIVFKAMVRDCFPHGVCWRSRKDNPANKWYFERAKGTWKMPMTNWTMFWTTEGVEMGESTFLAYERVCQSVVPSWADNKLAVD